MTALLPIVVAFHKDDPGSSDVHVDGVMGAMGTTRRKDRRKKKRQVVMLVDNTTAMTKDYIEEQHPRDDHGRWTDGSGSGAGPSTSHPAPAQDWHNANRTTPDDIAGTDRTLVQLLVDNGGFTFDLNTATAPTNGYMVAVQGHSAISTFNNPTDPGQRKAAATAIVQYVRANEQLFRSNKSLFLGGWHDTTHGELVLDPSEHVVDRQSAITLGQQRNQQSIWDVANGVEINTHGTGDRKVTKHGSIGLIPLISLDPFAKAGARHPPDRRHGRGVAEVGGGVPRPDIPGSVDSVIAEFLRDAGISPTGDGGGGESTTDPQTVVILGLDPFRVAKGDKPAHDFHGNQYTGGIGGGGDSGSNGSGSDSTPPGPLSGQGALSTFDPKFTPLVANRLRALHLASSSNDQTALGQAKSIFIANMERAYNAGQAADEQWYYQARAWAQGVGKQFGISLQQVAAVTSLTSALRSWDQNKEAATTILTILHDNKPFTVSPADAADFNARRADNRATVLPKAVAGTFLPQSMDLTQLAALHPGMPIGKVGIAPVINALRVIKGVPVDQVVAGPKQRSFVNNITDPTDARWTTIDTWMYRAMLGNQKFMTTVDGNTKMRTLAEYMKPRPQFDANGKPILIAKGPMAGKQKMKQANTSIFNSPNSKTLGVRKGVGLYPVFVDAVMEGAKLHGLLPHEYQARVWSTLVREGTAAKRSKK